MKTVITEFPIDFELEKKLGIYKSRYVKSISIGRILHALIKAGYTEIISFVECYEQDENKVNKNRLSIHCTKPRDY